MANDPFSDLPFFVWLRIHMIRDHNLFLDSPKERHPLAPTTRIHFIGGVKDSLAITTFNDLLTDGVRVARPLFTADMILRKKKVIV